MRNYIVLRTAQQEDAFTYIMANKLDIITLGELLRGEFMEPLGITAYRLAKDIDVTQDRISAILRGRRAITLDTAVRLGRYLSTTYHFWLNLQAEYELRLAKRSGTLKKIEAKIQPLVV
jgi:addiction module HigA family antidote